MVALASLLLSDTVWEVYAETEAALQSRLRETFSGRTVVIVANRVSTVRECDQNVVRDAGRMIEVGTHAVLMLAGREDARLSREQEREQRLAHVVEDVA